MNVPCPNTIVSLHGKGVSRCTLRVFHNGPCDFANRPAPRGDA